MLPPETTASIPPAVILAAHEEGQIGLNQVLLEVKRFGVTDLHVLGPEKPAAPFPGQRNGPMSRAAVAGDSLALLHGALAQLPASFLLLDASAMRETNLLALPLGRGPALSWSEEDDQPAGSAWMDRELLAALPSSGSVWHALARHSAVSRHPAGQRCLGAGNGPALEARPAVFLDRDGVLIADDGYPHDPAKVQWMPGSAVALRRLNDAGYFVFVVTNQSGVARGYYSEAAVHRLHDWMARTLAASGAHVDAFSYCPHHPSATIVAYRQICQCRKPAPGMILNLFSAWPIRRQGSFLIGDQTTDVQAAMSAQIPGHLFNFPNLGHANLDREIKRILDQQS